LVVDEVEPRIRELLAAYQRMPATVTAERISGRYSIRTLGERVRELRPVYLPPDPISRKTYQVWEIAQCDLWFPDVAIPGGCGQVRTQPLRCR
jgi:transposase